MPRAGMSAAAALLEATGIDPAAPVWGAPFRELAALYDGADPPLEALGVSAKFSNGKAATARYHTQGPAIRTYVQTRTPPCVLLRSLPHARLHTWAVV